MRAILPGMLVKINQDIESRIRHNPTFCIIFDFRASDPKPCTFLILEKYFPDPIWYVIGILSRDLIKKFFLKPIRFIVGLLSGGLVHFLNIQNLVYESPGGLNPA